MRLITWFFVDLPALDYGDALCVILDVDDQHGLIPLIQCSLREIDGPLQQLRATIIHHPIKKFMANKHISLLISALVSTTISAKWN